MPKETCRVTLLARNESRHLMASLDHREMGTVPRDRHFGGTSVAPPRRPWEVGVSGARGSG